jgi:hypothetical protein
LQEIVAEKDAQIGELEKRLAVLEREVAVLAKKEPLDKP